MLTCSESHRLILKVDGHVQRLGGDVNQTNNPPTSARQLGDSNASPVKQPRHNREVEDIV
jgi:hypothetical protein